MEDFALDENTKTYRASIENKKIHCSDLKDISSCIKGYKAENKNYPVGSLAEFSITYNKPI